MQRLDSESSLDVEILNVGDESLARLEYRAVDWNRNWIVIAPLVANECRVLRIELPFRKDIQAAGIYEWKSLIELRYEYASGPAMRTVGEIICEANGTGSRTISLTSYSEVGERFVAEKPKTVGRLLSWIDERQSVVRRATGS